MKRLEEPEARESEEFYKAIFESLPFVAFTLDRDGRILEANKCAEKLFGLRIGEVMDKKFSELGLLDKKDLIKAFIEFRKNLQGKVTEKIIYKVKLKDGREILLELIGIPLKQGGRVTKVLDVGSDITEQRNAEEELKRRNEELEKINKLSIGRELRMVELKNRIEKLERKAGRSGGCQAHPKNSG